MGARGTGGGIIAHQERAGLVHVEAGPWGAESGSKKSGGAAGRFGGATPTGRAGRRCRNGQEEYESGEPSAFERESRASRPSGLIQRGRTLPRKAAPGPPPPVGARRCPVRQSQRST